MIDLLLSPFTYDYMARAIVVCALVGAVCAFLSCFLMLKGWSLMGDALSHSIVPGVALAYLAGWPVAAGAFFAGLLAAGGMAAVRRHTKLREDAVIGLVFTTFFALGLLLVSINPVAVDIQGIVLGNILTLSDADVRQVVWMAGGCLAALLLCWKNLVAVFFDENHARSIGMPVTALRIMFFTMLSVATVAALQAVGACLVIAMVVTPGATAYLLSDRFGRMIVMAVLLGAATSALGAYASFFVNASTGGMIVSLQALLFGVAFVMAPKYGLLAARRKRMRGAL